MGVVLALRHVASGWQPLFRHVAEAVEDSMALEKRIWTTRAAMVSRVRLPVGR